MNSTPKNAMQKIRPYWIIFKTAMREDGANPSRLVASVLQTIARVLLVFVIYKAAYSIGSEQSLSLTNAVWTIAICFVFFINLGLRLLYIPIEREIKSGVVETSLIKPVSWRLSKFLYMLGKMLPEFLISLVLVLIILPPLVGLPSADHITWQTGGVFIAFLLLAIITASSIFMMVGMTAFWLNDARSVFRIVDKSALIFTGTFVPMALLPEVMQTIARYSPFGIYAAPTRIFDPTVMPVLWQTLAAGIAWSIIMIGLCQWMWTRVNKRIEVNGG